MMSFKTNTLVNDALHGNGKCAEHAWAVRADREAWTQA